MFPLVLCVLYTCWNCVDAAESSSPWQYEDDEEGSCAADGMSPGLCAMAALAKSAPPSDNASGVPDLDVQAPERLERALYAEIEAVLDGKHVGITPEHMKEIRADLEPTFKALPKNAHGGIDGAVTRYAIFKTFLRKHGWYIHSLNPAGESQTPASPAEGLRGRVPEHLLTLLEKKLAGKGLGLKELEAVVATFEHLIRGDLGERVKAAYKSQRFNVGDKLELWQAHEILRTVMAHYVSIEHRSGYSMTPEEAAKELREIRRYTGWPKVEGFIGDAASMYKKEITFAQSVEMSQAVTDRFEQFSVGECEGVRDGFLQMPNAKDSGFVLLADFHKAALDGKGSFAESAEYLRKAGVLDESNPKLPTVVLPNYMLSPSNCMATTSFFDLCCPAPCEKIRYRLETDVGSSDPTVAQVVSAVERIQPFVSRTGSLPAQLRTKLDTVATGGTVRLHGFAFAEWLHDAYPHECPKPRASDWDGGAPVPGGAHRELQDVANLRTLNDIVASTEELELEKVRLESLAEEAAIDSKNCEKKGLTPAACAMAMLAKNSPPSGSGASAKEPADDDFLRPDRLEQALSSEIESVLAGTHSGVKEGRVGLVEKQVRSLYEGLPKNQHGNLDHTTARYALFQRFQRRRGWYVRSLNPSGESQLPASKAEEVRGQVPIHLLNSLETKTGGKGINLKHFVAVVVTLEHLISSDMDQRIKAAYYSHHHSVNSSLSPAQANEVLVTWMAHFLSLEHRSGYALTPEAARKELAEIRAAFSSFTKVEGYIDKALKRSSKENNGASLNFASMVQAAHRVMEQYEEQSASDCLDIKDDFAKLAGGDKGRVLLADLHKAAMEGQGSFKETTEYLRGVGALDESDPAAPIVLMPNYIYSPSQCLGTTSFYDLCCPSECDLHRERLEQTISKSKITPKEVFAVFKSLSTNTKKDLETIAKKKGGSLALNGYGFSQWLHVAFPKECPMPNPSLYGANGDASIPSSNKDYQDVASMRSSMDITASQEELAEEVQQLEELKKESGSSGGGSSGKQRDTSSGSATSSKGDQADDVPSKKTSWTSTLLIICFLLLAVGAVGFFALQGQTASTSLGSGSKSSSHSSSTTPAQSRFGGSLSQRGGRGHDSSVI